MLAPSRSVLVVVSCRIHTSKYLLATLDIYLESLVNFHFSPSCCTEGSRYFVVLSRESTTSRDRSGALNHHHVLENRAPVLKFRSVPKLAPRSACTSVAKKKTTSSTLVFGTRLNVTLRTRQNVISHVRPNGFSFVFKRTGCSMRSDDFRQERHFQHGNGLHANIGRSDF